MTLLRIGQLARECGFTPKTLRYYEEVGVLSPARRAENGYRVYADDAVRRLRFVRRAKALGLPLADIRAILEISDEGRAPCQHVVAVIERELSGIDAQMRQLQDLKRDLLSLKSRMADAIASGVASGQDCPRFNDESLQPT